MSIVGTSARRHVGTLARWQGGKVARWQQGSSLSRPVLADGLREPSRPRRSLMEPMTWVGRWRSFEGLDEVWWCERHTDDLAGRKGIQSTPALHGHLFTIPSNESRAVNRCEGIILVSGGASVRWPLAGPVLENHDVHRLVVSPRHLANAGGLAHTMRDGRGRRSPCMRRVRPPRSRCSRSRGRC